jgi:hypothetical protein
VGGRWGNFSDYDFWTARKEVLLTADPRCVLDAVNDRAITRLAVPDRCRTAADHEFKEPAAADDRIASTWVYAGSGKVGNADIHITGLVCRTEMNARFTLDPVRRVSTLLESRSGITENSDPACSYIELRRRRRDEANAGLAAAQEARS